MLSILRRIGSSVPMYPASNSSASSVNLFLIIWAGLALKTNNLKMLKNVVIATKCSPKATSAQWVSKPLMTSVN